MQVRKLVQAMTRRRSLAVHYIARNVDPAYRPDGYEVHRIPPRRQLAGTLLLDIPGLLHALHRVQPDVIYQRVATAYTGASAYFARRHGKRMAWHVSSNRDLTPLPWELSLKMPLLKAEKRLISYGARTADTVVVQNAEQAEFLRRHHSRSDAVLIRNFHSAPQELPAKRADCVCVGWIGNIKGLKRPDLFLKLAADLRGRREVKFVMFGAPQLRPQEWEPMRRTIEGSSNLHYGGSVPQTEVETFLCSAHILVNTSEYEGFPNTFIQAWMRGVPVVSLAVNPDGVFDNDRCGTFAGNSYERLREQLTRLIDQPHLREQIGQRAAAYARTQFADSNAERLIDLLASGSALHSTLNASPSS